MVCACVYVCVTENPTGALWFCSISSVVHMEKAAVLLWGQSGNGLIECESWERKQHLTGGKRALPEWRVYLDVWALGGGKRKVSVR